MLATQRHADPMYHCGCALQCFANHYHTCIADATVDCRLSGKAAFGLGDAQRSQASYRRAIKLNAAGPPAWMGLAEVAESSGDAASAIEAYEHLVRHCQREHMCIYTPRHGAWRCFRTRSNASHGILYTQAELFGQAPETWARVWDCKGKLAAWYEQAGRNADAAALLQQMADEPGLPGGERIALLCRTADAQVSHQLHT
jgi:tetratricopeptide (TPR) repeat protein